MEKRQITIVSTKTQQNYVVETYAQTLGELKKDLDAKGIDYSDLTFFEGLSRTEMVDDNSLLPTNVRYKGEITNNLVFMLTQSNKKIKSGGMTEERKDIFKAIREAGLQQACFDTFGKAYSKVSNKELYEFLEENVNKPEGDEEEESGDIQFDFEDENEEDKESQPLPECEGPAKREKVDAKSTATVKDWLRYTYISFVPIDERLYTKLIEIITAYEEDHGEAYIEEQLYSSDEIRRMFDFI